MFNSWLLTLATSVWFSPPSHWKVAASHSQFKAKWKRIKALDISMPKPSEARRPAQQDPHIVCSSTSCTFQYNPFVRCQIWQIILSKITCGCLTVFLWLFFVVVVFCFLSGITQWNTTKADSLNQNRHTDFVKSIIMTCLLRAFSPICVCPACTTVVAKHLGNRAAAGCSGFQFGRAEVEKWFNFLPTKHFRIFLFYFWNILNLNFQDRAEKNWSFLVLLSLSRAESSFQPSLISH